MTELLHGYGPQLAVAAVLFGAWLLFRSRATDLESPAAIDSLASGGRPVVMEFFSNA